VIEAVTMYRVRCDWCRRTPNETEYYAWASPEQATEAATDGYWRRGSNQTIYCPDHPYVWESELDDAQPKPFLLILDGTETDLDDIDVDVLFIPDTTTPAAIVAFLLTGE